MSRAVRTALVSMTAFAAVFFLAPARATAVRLTSSLVAYTGQNAPGTSGPTFELLFTPSISEGGDIGFRGRLTGTGTNSGNNFGLWRTEGGPVLLHLRAGNAAPLAGTTWGTNFSDPNLQSAGNDALTAFTVQLNGTTSGASIWSELPAGLRKVAVLGEAAPGIAGATFSLLGGPLFNGSSETVFGGRVTGGGTVAANDDGIFFDDGTTMVLLARQGDIAPGTAPAAPFLNDFAGAGTILLADGGLVAFTQSVNLSGFLRNGIWSNHGGTIGLRAIDKGLAAGLGGNEHLNFVSALRGNERGQFSFLATIENQFDATVGSGLWISDEDGAPALALRRDGAEPGLSPNNAIRFVLADNGVLYLISTLFEDPAGSHDGIFAVTPTAGWRELVRVGERVPDLNAGIEYASFDQLVANGNGQVGFRATITGPGVVSTNNRVLVAQGSDLAFHLVARTGDPIEVSPGVFRTISTLNLTHTASGGDGGLRGISDDGGMVWLAGTGGSSSAILVANVGVPPTVQLAGLEAVQVVQDWSGSLPMVEGKRTYVRAHLQSTPAVDVQPLLRARPAGGGPELPFSPVFASNIASHVWTPPVAVSQRGDLLDSAYFEVPFEWTYLGDVELEVELPDRELDCVEAAGPVANDCKVQVSFDPVPHPEIRIVSVNYRDATGVLRLSVGQRLELARRLISAFPVSGLSWTGSGANWPGLAPPNPDTCLIRSWIYLRKILDGCREWDGCRRLDYGALLGDREDGCAQIAGFAAAGTLPSDPVAKGRHNHTHEFGHVLGLEHTVDPAALPNPDGGLPGFCSEVANPGAPPYPYIHEIGGNRRPTLGPLALGENAKVFALDTLQLRVGSPEQYFDLMSYCAVPGLDLWPGKTTYEFLKTAVETRFPRPSALQPRGAAGDPEVLLVSGTIEADGSAATLLAFLTTTAGAPFPTPDPGPYTLRVLRSGGGIEDHSFAPALIAGHGDNPTARPFFFEIDAPATVDGIEVRSGGEVLAGRAETANAPVVQVLSPNGGELLDQPTVEVSWSASDADGDPLVFAVQFSADAGATWTTLETNWNETTVEVDRTSLAGTTLGRIRVQASDGLRTASDESDGSFEVANNLPEVTILAPDSGGLLYDGQVLLLEAMAIDAEDGALSGAAITWSSSLSGDLGAGEALTVAVSDLADGLHVLTVTAEDSDGNTATAQVSVRVDQPALLFEDDFESGGTTRWQ